MTVKIRRTKFIMGKDVQMAQYEPKNAALTKERRQQADLLDEELKYFCNKINEKYDKLNVDIKKNELKKWKWLGGKLDAIIHSAKNIQITDVDNHLIWPAIGQHLRKELSRGIDTRRSGSSKDHYRKCWLLATIKDLEWINSWSGWDAFVDRGNQIIMSKKIMPILKFKFADTEFKPKDYQLLAKIIVDYLPSAMGKLVDIDSMSIDKIQEIIEKVYQKYNS